MITRFHSDNGAPCWKCNGTVFTYVCDDCVSYIGAKCIGCRADNVFYPPQTWTLTLDTAARISQAHRESQG